MKLVSGAQERVRSAAHEAQLHGRPNASVVSASWVVLCGSTQKQLDTSELLNT